MSFARALRAILRQDPDVIMVGEIRDLETAQIAVQASLTGHLCAGHAAHQQRSAAVNRLIDMGLNLPARIQPLLGVLAQRLVRCLCPECRRGYATRCRRAGCARACQPARTALRAGGLAPPATAPGYLGPHRHIRTAGTRRRICAV